MSFHYARVSPEFFRFLKIYSGGRRRRFGILLLLSPLHHAICCIILIVLLYMYNSDKCCINNCLNIVNSFMNCLFDYYILSFRCEIPCCFISFISPFLSFLNYPNNHLPFFNGLEPACVFDRRFKLSKKAGRYIYLHKLQVIMHFISFGIAV